MPLIRDWPGLTLRIAQARDAEGDLSPRVFLVGGAHETRVTVVAQQTRAINLAAALHESGRLKDDDGIARRVGVIGAGAAGATFAAAAHLLGAHVTLFDEHEEPISTQRWTLDRYLHPHLFDWPVDGWDEPEAGLPLMSWKAGPSAMVRLHMLADFWRAAAQPVPLVLQPPNGSGRMLRYAKEPLAWRPQHSVSEIAASGDKVALTVCDLRSVAEDGPAVRMAKPKFDEVVVACGFLSEEPVKGAAVSGTYWKPCDLESAFDASRQAAIQIVGDGDGALTELLRLRLEGREARCGFRQAMLTRVARELLDSDPGRIRRKVLDVEAGISGGRGRSSLQQYDSETFAATDPVIDAWLREDAPPIEVRAGESTLRRNSFALNRFLAARLIGRDDVALTRGPRVSPGDVERREDLSVIWRVGPPQRDVTRLIEPALAVRDAADAMSASATDNFHDVLGVVDDLMDVSREPRWSDDIRAVLSAEREGAVLDAAVELEVANGIASSVARWTPRPWPGLIESRASESLRDTVLALASTALRVGTATAPYSWSNHQIDPHGRALLSLDLVAVAADCTPAQVIDHFRLGDHGEISLVIAHVKRGSKRVERLWVRVGSAKPPQPLQVPAGPVPELWTLVALLLSPGLAPGDSRIDDTMTAFEIPLRPSIDDEALATLVDQVIAERALASIPSTDGTAQKSAALEAIKGPTTLERSEAQLCAAAVDGDGDPSLEQALVTVFHRRLGDSDAYLHRASLVGLATLLGDGDRPGSLAERYVEALLRLPRETRGREDHRAAALVNAAMGPLVRRDPGGAGVTELPSCADLLRLEWGAVIDACADVSTERTPDLSAFAVMIGSEEPR